MPRTPRKSWARSLMSTLPSKLNLRGAAHGNHEQNLLGGIIWAKFQGTVRFEDEIRPNATPIAKLTLVIKDFIFLSV